MLQASVGKVHIFWEGHKILRNLHRRFDHYYIGQIYCGDFAKICGLLRIYEFYFFKLFTVDNTLHNKDKWLIILGKSYSNMRSSHNDDKSFVKQNSYHRIARTNLKRSLDKYHYSIKIQTREAQNQHQLKSLSFRLDLANTVIYIILCTHSPLWLRISQNVLKSWPGCQDKKLTCTQDAGRIREASFFPQSIS